MLSLLSGCTGGKETRCDYCLTLNGISVSRDEIYFLSRETLEGIDKHNSKYCTFCPDSNFCNK